MRLTGVAAAIVAFGLVAGCSTQPFDRTGVAPSPSSKQSVVEPSPSVIRPAESPLSALPEGTPPKIGYAERNTFVAPDGDRIRLRLPLRGGVGAFVQYGSGFVVADEIVFEGTVGLTIVESDGSRIKIDCSGGPPVPSKSGQRAAWTTIPCPESGVPQPKAAIHLGGRVQVLGGDHLTVIGIVGERVIFTHGFTDGVWTTDLDSMPQRIPSLRDATRVNARRDLLSGRQSERSSDVVRISSGRRLWTSPKGWELQGFSPDGRRVVGLRQGEADADGWAVFDSRTGKVQGTFALPKGVEVVGVEWEDNRHLLLVAAHERHTTIVRADLDGSLARVTPILKSRGVTEPYVLARQS